MTLKEDITDLCSAVSLFYLGEGPNELVGRMMDAMEQNDLAEMIHLSALMMNHLAMNGLELPAVLYHRWGRLSRAVYGCDSGY